MKKKLLKIFSIIFSIATLMPTTTSVVWANGSESESEDSSSSSKANSKSSKNSAEENNTSETEDTELDESFNKFHISNQTNTYLDSPNQVSPIYKTFPGKAIDKIRRKRENIENGHFKYMSAALTNFLKENIKKNHYRFNTPFGLIYVKYSEPSNDYIIYDENKKAYKYNDLYDLFEKLNENTEQNRKILNKIYEYICMPYYKTIKTIKDFNLEVTPYFSQLPGGINKNKLAAFCGILMFAEPFRFEDGGGLTRSHIRKVWKLMAKGEAHPYSIIFGDLGSLYLYGKDDCEFRNEPLAIYAHTDNKNRTPSRFMGGKQQQLNQINGWDNSSYENENSFNDNKKRMNCIDSDVSGEEEEEEEKEKPNTSTKKLNTKSKSSIGTESKTKGISNSKKRSQSSLAAIDPNSKSSSNKKGKEKGKNEQNEEKSKESTTPKKSTHTIRKKQ